MTTTLPNESQAPAAAPAAQLRKLAAQRKLLAGQARTLAAQRRAVSAELKQLAAERKQLASQRTQLTQQVHQLAAQRRQLNDQARQLVDPAYVPVPRAPAKATRKARRTKVAAAVALPATVAQPWLPSEQEQPPVPLVPAQPLADQHQLRVNGQQSAALDADELMLQIAAAFESINVLFLQLSGFELQQHWLEAQRDLLRAENSSTRTLLPSRSIQRLPRRA